MYIIDVSPRGTGNSIRGSRGRGEMRTLVILLSSFLFHWEAVSRGIPSETPRQGGEGEERLGIAGEERILDEVGGGGTSLVDDGRQKSRPTRDGLTRREIGSVEEAWSGTDWGGSHLPRFAEDRQVCLDTMLDDQKARLLRRSTTRHLIFFRFVGYVGRYIFEAK